MSSTLRLCTFQVGGASYGLPLAAVTEIVRRPTVTAVPLAPAAFLGLINLRGQILPVVDAQPILGVSREGAPAGFVMVVQAAADSIGLLVDEVGDVIEIEVRTLEPVPHVSALEAGKTVRGVHAGPDGLLVALDLERFVEKLLAASGSTVTSAPVSSTPVIPNRGAPSASTGGKSS